MTQKTAWQSARSDRRTACLKMPMLVSRSEDDRSLDQADPTGHDGEYDRRRLRQNNRADERHARTYRAKVVISDWDRRTRVIRERGIEPRRVRHVLGRNRDEIVAVNVGK